MLANSTKRASALPLPGSPRIPFFRNFQLMYMRKTTPNTPLLRLSVPKLCGLLTLLALLFGNLTLMAADGAQDKISLHVKSADLKKVLSEIQKQTGYRFLYNQALVSNKKVDVDVTDAEVPAVLNAMLEGKGIGYRILQNKLVVLKSDAEGKGIEVADIRITGRVIGAGGEPLVGVSVSAKGTSIGTTTDGQGNFALSVPDATTTLVFSSVGFVSQEVAINGRTAVNVTLAAAPNALSEVVVIGYGTANRRDLTGSIVKIAGKEVADKPNTNPVASLQGKVTGLSVVNSGTPGQEPDIRIRGTMSLGSVKPLYVVDGILNDNIAFLNPNDIESIEILKDPSSLAIFGVRGAAGVIAITTKKARAGQMAINFNTTFGVRRLVDKIQMTNAAQFRELFQEQEVNDQVPANLRFDFSKWNADTDWIDELTRNGLFTQNNLSITGGTDKNRFYMGLGYAKEQGIVKHEELSKYNITFNNELTLSRIIKVGFNFNGLHQRLPFSQANGLLFDARRILPITAPRDPSGQYFTELAIQSAQISNPLMNLEEKWDNEIRRENRFVGNVYADLTLFRDLNFRSTFYLDASQVEDRRYSPLINTYSPITNTVFVDRNNRTTGVSESHMRYMKAQQDHILTYRKNISQHNFTATGGFTTYYNEVKGLNASVSQSTTGDPIPDDPRFWYIDNGFGDQATRRSSSPGQSERFLVSGLFRVLYNFSNRYYLNASYRRDVASVFSEENRGKNFYSVGAAWEISKEGFMANQRVFDFLKLKASWGVLGGQNTYGFDYPLYPGLLTGNTAVFGNVLAPAYSLAYQPDPNITWETMNAKEVGLEGSLLQNRMRFEFAYFDRKTQDMLALIDDGSGRNRLSNVGDMSNRGFEGLVGWRQSVNRNLSFNVSANITTFRNEVLALGGDRIPASEERPNQTEAGKPIGYFFGYVVEGIYQSYADKLASPTVVGYDYGPGDLKYKDVNGDGVIDTKDRTQIGNPTPDFIYGASLGMNYRNLEITADFNGSYGNEIYRFWGSSELPFTQFNFGQFRTDRWRGEGTSNWEPAVGTTRTINRLPSTYGIEDGSYIRLRNLQIAYTVKPSALRGVIKNMRVFVNAQNPKTWKRNSGYTPEFGGDALSFGIDNGNGPVPAVYTAGLNLTF